MLGAVDLWHLIFVQIKRDMNEARPATLSQLSKLGATKFRMRLNEPFGQRQSAIYSALGAVCGEYYTAHHLPCLNHALSAAKTTCKDKQPLGSRHCATSIHRHQLVDTFCASSLTTPTTV